jgi:hypothetical protein
MLLARFTVIIVSKKQSRNIFKRCSLVKKACLKFGIRKTVFLKALKPLKTSQVL